MVPEKYTFCFQCQQAICQETNGRLCQYWWIFLKPKNQFPTCFYLKLEERAIAQVHPPLLRSTRGKAAQEKGNSPSPPTLPHTSHHFSTSSGACFSNFVKKAQEECIQGNALRSEVELWVPQLFKCLTILWEPGTAFEKHSSSLKGKTFSHDCHVSHPKPLFSLVPSAPHWTPLSYFQPDQNIINSVQTLCKICEV